MTTCTIELLDTFLRHMEHGGARAATGRVFWDSPRASGGTALLEPSRIDEEGGRVTDIVCAVADAVARGCGSQAQAVPVIEALVRLARIRPLLEQRWAEMAEWMGRLCEVSPAAAQQAVTRLLQAWPRRDGAREALWLRLAQAVVMRLPFLPAPLPKALRERLGRKLVGCIHSEHAGVCQSAMALLSVDAVIRAVAADEQEEEEEEESHDARARSDRLGPSLVALAAGRHSLARRLAKPPLRVSLSRALQQAAARHWCAPVRAVAELALNDLARGAAGELAEQEGPDAVEDELELGEEVAVQV